MIPLPVVLALIVFFAFAGISQGLFLAWVLGPEEVAEEVTLE